ncbi:transcription factor ETV7 isoform X15 [Paralichthys olivaceus]|uniref:transcription factor ETV7 isoform X15 n=1 Tax=Paralichthys olivaceus TaxID=8255 RepID=UPI003752ABA5
MSDYKKIILFPSKVFFQVENFSLSPLDKENTANTLSSSMNGEQANKCPSVHHSPAHHPQEDLWHLPGRLRINPSLWDKEDVAHWLHWAQREYSLRRSEKGPFEMNGRALCLLTKEDFRRRCPSSGDVLYEILQCVKQQRRGAVCDPQNKPPALTLGNIHSQGPVICQVPAVSVQEPQPPTVNDTQDPPLDQGPAGFPRFHQRSVNSCGEHCEPIRAHVTSQRSSVDLSRSCCSTHTYYSCPHISPQQSSVSSNKEHQPGAPQPVESREEPSAQSQWSHPRFLKLPQDIRKQQADPAESPEHTSPPDGNFSDSSPVYEINEDHFEISPDRMSPQPPLTDAPVR